MLLIFDFDTGMIECFANQILVTGRLETLFKNLLFFINAKRLLFIDFSNEKITKYKTFTI